MMPCGTPISCEPSNDESTSGSTKEPSLVYLRKRATLRKAVGETPPAPSVPGNSVGELRHGRQNFTTSDVLNSLRHNQAEIMKRWERDEDGWRELPARAWPPFQPKPSEMEEIRKDAQERGCDNMKHPDDACKERFFQISTTLVFYNIDALSGFDQFLELAKSGYVDAMVACGVILVEGFGVPPNEKEGIIWLRRAAEKGSSQAHYELASIYYTGITDILEEDEVKAFLFFEKAAKQNHVAAMYMMAECLAEGEGIGKDMARAVPLFYEAAERGHRYARQRIRELLANPDYKKE